MTQQKIISSLLNQDTSSVDQGRIASRSTHFLLRLEKNALKIRRSGSDYIIASGTNTETVSGTNTETDVPSVPNVLRTFVPRPSTSIKSGDEFAKKLRLSEIRLKDAISEGLKDGCEPTPQAMMGAYDMLSIVDKATQGRNVKTFVTDDQDVVTDVTDCEQNYVMLVNRADGTAAVHFNIRSYQEYENQGEVSEEFVDTLLQSLKHRASAP